jgi:hypothetical protein
MSPSFKFLDSYSTYPKSVEIINLDEDSPGLVCNNLPGMKIILNAILSTEDHQKSMGEREGKNRKECEVN